MNTVLIVDDDLGFQRLLGISLQKFKKEFEVLLANNGEEAMAVLARKSVNLIVTDIQMPKVDGLALLAHVNDTYPGTSAVIMTAHSTPGLETQFAQSGQLLLKKPFTMDTLVEVIREALAPSQPEGMLKGISVASFLQMIELEQKSCVLEVIAKTNEKGDFYIEKGEVYDARFQDLQGAEAACALIVLEGASIRFADPATKKIERTIKSSLMALIMKSMTHKDETDASG